MVSIVTATWNLIAAGRQESIAKCIRSVGRVKTPHEHIIFDGASSDGTAELLRSLCVGRSDVFMHSERDNGIYDAFNKGVRAARGEWIYFIGSDDFIFDPSVFDEVVAMAMASRAGLVISPVRNSNGTCYFSARKDFGNILIIKPYCHQGVLMRRTVIERLGFFDGTYRIAADFKLCLMAHLNNIKQLTIWKRYAEFSVSDGISNADSGEYEERVRVTAEVLRLRDREIETLRQRKLLPIRIITAFLFHRNPIIRYGAFHALKRRVAFSLGFLDSHGNR